MRILWSFPQPFLTKEQGQAAFQNNKQAMVGLINLMVFFTCLVGGSVMYFYEIKSSVTLWLSGFVCLFGWRLSQAGHQKSAAVVLIGALLAAIQYNLYQGFGIHDVAIIAWPALIFFSGLIFGSRSIPYITALIIFLAVVAGVSLNAQVFPDYSDTGDLIVMLLILVTFSLITLLILSSTEQAIGSLQQSEERFQAIYNSINDAILIHDAQTGAILDVNEKMLRMYGYTHAEAIRLDLLTLSSGFPPYTKESAMEWIKKAVSQGAQNFEWQAKDKSGRLFWVDVNMKCATIANQTQILVSVRDISDRKQAEEDIREAKENFELIFNKSPNMAIITRLDDTRIVKVNDAFTEISGFTRQEVIGKTTLELDLWKDPGSRLRYITDLRQKGFCKEIEVEFQRKDGAQRVGILSANTASSRGIPVAISITHDITEYKRSETALQESETRFLQVADLLPQVIFECDLQGQITYTNQYALDLFGYEQFEPGLNVLNFLDETQHPRLLKTIQRLRNGQDQIDHEFYLRHKDSNQIPVLIYASVVRKENQPCGFRGVMIDISEIKRSEIALRESEERYRHLYENSTVGLYRTTPDGRMLLANPTMVEMLGFSSFSDLSARNLEELGIELGYERAHFLETIEQDGAVKGIESTWIRPDGTVIMVRESAGLTRDQQGNTLYYDGIIEDITGHKRAEANYRAIFDNATVGIFQSWPEGRFCSVNPAMARIYGYATPQEMLDSISDISRQIYVDPASRQDFQRQLAEHGDVNKFVGENFCKDGSIIWTSTNARVVKDTKGQILYYEGFITDITERKQAVDALQKASEELGAAYDATLQGWSTALEMREHETAGHSQRVVQLAEDLAKRMGIGTEGRLNIQRGALLHDIGKMGIPDSILLKPGPLTEDEWVVMRQHPLYAYRLLSKISYLTNALDIPYSHHEKWDGTGYPRKLKGLGIPLAARIFAVIDVWDALSHPRPYRPAWTEEAVIQYLSDQRGRHFDPQVVDMFLSLIQ